MAVDTKQSRSTVIQGFFVLATAVLVFQLLNLQVLNTEFQLAAESAGRQIELNYPSRGLLLDRNKKLLVVNTPIYDLEVIYNQFEESSTQFDTAKFCQLLQITPEYFEATLYKDFRNNRQYSRDKPFIFLRKISPALHATLQESLYQFPGFYIQERNARAYPHQSAAHALGYIGEVSPKMLSDSNQVGLKIYGLGDYVGTSGLEKQYEYFLRGAKGERYVEKDILGRTIGSINEGKQDSPPIAGYDIYTTLDLELQEYGEKLMQNKIGSVVAIEPATGEILAMISTPAYAPADLALGTERGINYMNLLNDSLQPFFNRGLQAQYPPGSLFKPIVALIGLQEGVLTPDRTVHCQGAYYFDGMRLTGCHNHPTCFTVAQGIQHSCNAYFVTAFREIIDRFDDERTPRKGLNSFNDYLRRFGMGNKLGIDFPGEKAGNIPSSAYFDKIYEADKVWRSIWIRSLGIGQGELLTTNLQLANMAAVIANRGFYIVPHFAKYLQDQDGNKLTEILHNEKVMSGIDAQHFPPVIDGMELVVQAGTAQMAYIPGIPVCGKTGTAENPHGKDHSIFFAFAPKENPQIAIAVYVEKGGWGGSYAAPIVSLMIEKYINRTIAPNRQWLEDRMVNADLIGRVP